MRQNAVGDDGALALTIGACSPRSRLLELYLGLNRLSSAGVCAVFNALLTTSSSSPPLRTLDLQSAPIDIAASKVTLRIFVLAWILTIVLFCLLFRLLRDIFDEIARFENWFFHSTYRTRALVPNA